MDRRRHGDSRRRRLGAKLTLEGGERVIRWVVVFSIAGMMVKLIWFL